MPYREEKTIRETYTKTYNETFGILSAIAMVMIVAGHLGYDLMSVGELFPYFVFVSLLPDGAVLLKETGKARYAGKSAVLFDRDGSTDDS